MRTWPWQRRCIGGFLLILACAEAAPTRFSLYAWPTQGIMGADSKISGIPKLFIQEGGRMLEVTAPRGTLGREFAYSGPSPLVLYRLDAPAPVEGELSQPPPVWVPYASIGFQPAWEQATVLLFPDAAGAAGGIPNTALDFHPERVPAGKATIYNGSRGEIAFSVKGRAYRLAPGQRTVLSKADVEERRTQGLSAFRLVIASPNTRDQWQVLYSNNHYLEPDRRCLFVVMDYGNRLQVRNLSALPPPPP